MGDGEGSQWKIEVVLAPRSIKGYLFGRCFSNGLLPADSNPRNDTTLQAEEDERGHVIPAC